MGRYGRCFIKKYGFEDDFIQLPGEVTANGQFLNQLQIFIENNNGGAKDRQDVTRHGV